MKKFIGLSVFVVRNISHYEKNVRSACVPLDSTCKYHKDKFRGHGRKTRSRGRKTERELWFVLFFSPSFSSIAASFFALGSAPSRPRNPLGHTNFFFHSSFQTYDEIFVSLGRAFLRVLFRGFHPPCCPLLLIFNWNEIFSNTGPCGSNS